jgi:hypothetical protein
MFGLRMDKKECHNTSKKKKKELDIIPQGPQGLFPSSLK